MPVADVTTFQMKRNLDHRPLAKHQSHQSTIHQFFNRVVERAEGELNPDSDNVSFL